VASCVDVCGTVSQIGLPDGEAWMRSIVTAWNGLREPENPLVVPGLLCKGMLLNTSKVGGGGQPPDRPSGLVQ
jgi:hypothetical protein